MIKDGSYFRKDDSRSILRFKCKSCNKRFSSSTSTLEYKHKKRRINHPLYKLLASGISMRRAAIILNVHRTTIDRKLIYLAQKARLSHEAFLGQLKNSKVTHLQFDDLITIEHTKLKPLSISIAVDAKRRFILGAEVSQIPSFGHLAKLSRQKYGKRKSFHVEKLDQLFVKINAVVDQNGRIESDEHQNYAPLILKHFPMTEYKQYKGAKGAVVGLGELKKLYHDPLFKINHTCAMFRANINRLFRKTWCTTKKPENLQRHLDIFIDFYNQHLLKTTI